MEGERGAPRDTAIPPSSVLKGRLSDVFVPALVGGATSALLRRLGTRATLDDPSLGRCASVHSIEETLTRLARGWHDAQGAFTPAASTTGVDCDVSEGVLALEASGTAYRMPIAVVAERRSMREIDVRLYYVPPSGRETRVVAPTFVGIAPEPRAAGDREWLAALRRGDVESALAVFEHDGRAVDGKGRVHARETGELEAWLRSFAQAELDASGTADDGRRSCLELARRTPSGVAAALLVLVRGDSGLVREALAYGTLTPA